MFAIFIALFLTLTFSQEINKEQTSQAQQPEIDNLLTSLNSDYHDFLRVSKKMCEKVNNVNVKKLMESLDMERLNMTKVDQYMALQRFHDYCSYNKHIYNASDSENSDLFKARKSQNVKETGGQSTGMEGKGQSTGMEGAKGQSTGYGAGDAGFGAPVYNGAWQLGGLGYGGGFGYSYGLGAVNRQLFGLTGYGAGAGVGYGAGLGYGAGAGLGYGAGIGYGAGAGLGYGAGIGYGAGAGYGLGAGAGYGFGAPPVTILGAGANGGFGMEGNGAKGQSTGMEGKGQSTGMEGKGQSTGMEGAKGQSTDQSTGY